MKQQVFYIHGGDSYENHEDYIEYLKTKDIWDLPGTEQKGKWTATLAADLGEDYEVFMPLMPNKQNAHYEEWKIWFERHFEHLRDDLIVIGCSLGAMFVAKYFAEAKLPIKIKALIFMACPTELSEFEDEGCGDFRFPDSAISQLSGKAAQIIIMHSKDDFLVPYECALKFKELLPEAELITFEDKNHFLVPELPELIEKIKQIAGE